MRFWPVVVGGMLLGAGCAHQPGRAAGRSGAASTIKVTPVRQLHGTVVSVNQRLRFVVIDFYLSPLPQPDQLLNVYHRGQKIGEVRVSGPSLKQNVAADIIAGDAQSGDEARPD